MALAAVLIHDGAHFGIVTRCEFRFSDVVGQYSRLAIAKISVVRRAVERREGLRRDVDFKLDFLGDNGFVKVPMASMSTDTVSPG